MFRKKFIPLNEMFRRFHENRFNNLLDRLTFLHILLIWISMIVVFGGIYFFFTTANSYLYNDSQQQPAQLLIDHIYFSFVTATSTGFGDIIPLGHFKFMAVIEVIFGLLLLAVVTSKLVSLKQDIILGEIYDISFEERINRLRSSLLLFRQNLGRIVSKVEEGSIHRREIQEIYVYLSSFEDTLNGIIDLIDRKGKQRYTKEIDEVDTQLILNSVNSSFEKLRELLTLFNLHKEEWKRDITLDLLRRCLKTNTAICDTLRIAKKVPLDLLTQNKEILVCVHREMENS